MSPLLWVNNKYAHTRQAPADDFKTTLLKLACESDFYISVSLKNLAAHTKIEGRKGWRER